jgi:hypothetical protein
MTHLWPTAGFAAWALISFALLTVALRYLEVERPTRCGPGSARPGRRQWE